MARKVDKEVLDGFVEEVRSYLPIIFDRLETIRSDPSKMDAMEEAHRHTHTIKGASSMLGFSDLSHIAYYVEEILKDIESGQLAMDDEIAETLYRMILKIDDYLEGISSGTLLEGSILIEVAHDFRRLRGLPEDEDEAAVTETLADIADMSFSGNADDATPIVQTIEEMAETEEVSSELIETFILEAEDHIRNISTLLASLDKQPEERGFLQDIRRGVHTLKGAAGAVGLKAIAQLAHRMEDLLDQLYDGKFEIDADIMDLLFSSADVLEDLSLGETDSQSMQDTLMDLYSRYASLLDLAPSQDKLAWKLEQLGDEKVIDLFGMTSQQREDITSDPKVEEVVPTRRMPSEVVRVPLERLDDLVRLVSELVIDRSVFEQRMADFIREVDELQLSSDRLRRVSTRLDTQYEVSALGARFLTFGSQSGEKPGLRSLTSETHGFDDLEFDRYTEFHLLSRELVETTSDIRTVGNALGTLIGDFDSIMSRQGRLTSVIQDRLMRTRMVPLATLATRLHRTVRVLARERGKLADLVIEGENIELDKTVLEEMADPLLHLLRNAVDHGIEPPDLRQVIGKPERGLIRLKAFYEGNQVVILVSDDGAGLEPQILRSAAITKGYVSETEAPLLSGEDLNSLIFLPGFSTAGEISEVSGRGVGLDIVKTNVHKLKGSIALDSAPGQGVTFSIRLPMTMAVTRALLVKAHGERFAIPLDAVMQILRLERDEVERVGQEPVVRVEEQVYPMLRLGEVLGLNEPADVETKRMPVLILNTGAEQIALGVDQLLAGREIVIKALGNHLRRVHGISGATLLGDGSVVLILNPAELVVEAAKLEAKPYSPSQAPVVAGRKIKTVMIVDDSPSVRRVVSNLIISAGWRPLTAKDGLEALEIVQRTAELPDIILVDIEMPRMDGYELMSTLKAQDEYQNIPLVVLTSRAGEKHRKRAMELGASDYIVKPYQDELLISIITHLSEESRRAIRA